MEITPAQAPTNPRLGRYDIDPASSAVRFRTRHLFGLAPVRGRFQIRAGTVDVTEPASESRVRVEIDTASLKSGNPRGTPASGRHDSWMRAGTPLWCS